MSFTSPPFWRTLAATSLAFVVICSPVSASPSLHGTRPNIVLILPDGSEGDIINLDENIGKMMAYLETSGLSENTLVLHMGDNGAGNKQLRSGKTPELYNMHSDIREQHNLADQHPDIVSRLKQPYDLGGQTSNRISSTTTSRKSPPPTSPSTTSTANNSARNASTPPCAP